MNGLQKNWKLKTQQLKYETGRVCLLSSVLIATGNLAHQSLMLINDSQIKNKEHHPHRTSPSSSSEEAADGGRCWCCLSLLAFRTRWPESSWNHRELTLRKHEHTENRWKTLNLGSKDQHQESEDVLFKYQTIWIKTTWEQNETGRPDASVMVSELLPVQRGPRRLIEARCEPETRRLKRTETREGKKGNNFPAAAAEET